ncbi:hypothetical protein PV08_08711 [Exophiala spinifera]|uniref:Uncharacterized protein n=1 Tax=Exophiala spinifera TaxID=91928 RepID=A0A0D2B3S4_9EURO|nr:uncharacterized protein PV08_08711 [Exophiala spinifera]KIW13523.1 hypothetical protein PV08_08711 [Exophiala spinifera]
MSVYGEGTQMSNREIPFAHMRVHFEDFANELRLHRHQEHRKRILFHRRDKLRTAVALASRLHRVGSWLHDGLVAISRQSEASGFSRVHHRMQDLADSCFSSWRHEIYAYEISPDMKTPMKDSFLSRLPAYSQDDCLELIHTLRSKPRFLVERFKAMSPAQIVALSTAPKYRELSESVLTSLSQNSGRGSQRRRINAYSKELEDYSSSFERTNPLSFIIHNIYGPFPNIDSKESRLRFSTWSSVCATLMVESQQAFHALIGQLLSAFANMYAWQIKPRLELYLMSVLQRGAFLLDMVEHPFPISQSEFALFDPFNTQEARKFFQEAVQELFDILACDEGLPIGALSLGRAIIGKLPTEELQSQFRGLFFFEWFLRDFLRVAIAFPEDEKLLHQFHVSDRARSYLLHTIWDRAYTRARDAFNPIPADPEDVGVNTCVSNMINQLDAEMNCFDPYCASNPASTPFSEAFISISAADVVHTLEALNPQYIHTSSPWDPFLSSSHSTFSRQYAHASGRFDTLRRRILEAIEPGQSSRNIHPCQENWALIVISEDGMPIPTRSIEMAPMSDGLGELDIAEKAAIRLIEGSPSSSDRASTVSISAERMRGSSLSRLFAEEARLALVGHDSVTSMFWHDAMSFLRQSYPLTVLTEDDTKILAPMSEKLRVGHLRLGEECLRLEQEVARLDRSYELAKSKMSQLSTWLEKLRIKLWYRMYVVSSDAYEDAKNVSTALNNMALPALHGSSAGRGVARSPGTSRPGTSVTSTSSLFEQTKVDTMSILKAPAEHGGPKKLADSQIERTKKWLERNHLDNFCRGEERIHRFCMEVSMATKKLVGETLGDSPVLWSSELFGRERERYDVHSAGSFSAQPSSRAPSVWSEPLSSTSYPSRSAFGGGRASLYSPTSGKLGLDLASVISSPGRANTVTTVDSNSSIWSPPVSNPRSVTSVSSQSRPASTFEDSSLHRLVDHSLEKATFLENLSHDLTCLLLSDLACPVWSCGSETDAWINTVLQTPSIRERLAQRSVMARLLSRKHPLSRLVHATGRKKNGRHRRSQSTTPSTSNPHGSRLLPKDPLEDILDMTNLDPGSDGFSYRQGFDDVFTRISEHVDPSLKLEAIHDLLMLSQACQQRCPNPGTDPANSPAAARRQSLNPSVLSANLERRSHATDKAASMSGTNTSGESEVVQFLKRLLFLFQPKTMFRDLQYVAAFVSSDTLNDTEIGRGFLQVGLAALAWKDEVCRAMVDVADRIVAKDSIKRRVQRGERNEPSILKAAEYWVIAAREGNAIAQRELAGLYLTHPEVPPVISAPLSLSSEIFKIDMMWEEQEGSGRSSLAMCLALHWMQQAAENGDEVAQLKLRERLTGLSIR